VKGRWPRALWCANGIGQGQPAVNQGNGLQRDHQAVASGAHRTSLLRVESELELLFFDAGNGRLVLKDFEHWVI
jgi:hypothetical protein